MTAVGMDRGQPGRYRTSKTIALQRHEFESRRDSILPYPSPVLGMATAVWNLPAPAPDGLVTWCTREVARGVVPTPVCW